MLNAHVFQTRPAVLEELKTLREDIHVVSRAELQKALCSLLSWVNKCIACEGHLTDTVFKILDIVYYVLNFQSFLSILM